MNRLIDDVIEQAHKAYYEQENHFEHNQILWEMLEQLKPYFELAEFIIAKPLRRISLLESYGLLSEAEEEQYFNLIKKCKP